jgi:N4-(beta-N-acetylglucosaminyl)-L-asparaginase
MSNRRRFLRQAVFGGLALSNPAFLAGKTPPGKAPKGALPVVIATWDNRMATTAAWEILKNGGRALDAVEAGARVPEADPNDSSVGYGGFPDRDGFVTLDACIMDELGRAGSVSCLQHIMHPISVARKVMEQTPHVMLVGEGALQFALNQGFKKENLLTDNAREAWEKWKITSQYKPVINWERHDTIGIVAIDKANNVSGACSTSGMAFKMHGRVGDSPIIGAGMFADNDAGVAACTGLGEMVLRTMTSYLAVEELRRGAHPQKAAERAIMRIIEKMPEMAKENQIGIVVLDKRGRHGAYSVQPGFVYALYQKDENKVFEAKSYYTK